MDKTFGGFGEPLPSDRQGAKEEQKIESINDLLKVVDTLLGVPGGEIILRELIIKGYGGTVGKYRPLINLLPDVLELAGGDMASVFTALYKTLNDLAEDKGIEAEAERGRKIKAKKRKKALDAYKEAGFTPSQAFALLLLDTANAKNAGLVPELMKNISKAGEETKRTVSSKVKR